MAQKTDIVIKRGSTYQQTIEAVDVNGDPVDLTGWTLQFMVKRAIDDSDADALVSERLTGIANPTLGLCTFTIPAATTALYPILEGVYAYQVIDDAGVVAESEAGTCEIRADIIQGTT